jgi:hypothetical protein
VRSKTQWFNLRFDLKVHVQQREDEAFQVLHQVVKAFEPFHVPAQMVVKGGLWGGTEKRAHQEWTL